MFVPSAPGSGASAAEIVSFYNEHGCILLATWSGGAIPLIPSIVFLAGLVALMRRIEGDPGWLWLALLLGAVGIATAAMAIQRPAGSHRRLPPRSPSDRRPRRSGSGDAAGPCTLPPDLTSCIQPA
jgi:hypothetical protein